MFHNMQLQCQQHNIDGKIKHVSLLQYFAGNVLGLAGNMMQLIC